MNLLAGLILLIGGYKIYDKLSAHLPEDEEPPPPTAAAPAAQPAQAVPVAPAATAAAVSATAAGPAGTTAPAGAAPGATDTNATFGTTKSESGAVFPTLATGAMPDAAPTFTAGAATPSTPAFPAMAAGGGAAVPAFPGGGGAAAPAPSFPGGGGTGFASSLQQLQPKDFVSALPGQAQASYLDAHDKAEKENDMMPLRSWMTLWLNQMRDPNRTLLELDLIKLLMRAQPQKQGAAARSFEEMNLRDAKGRMLAMRTRRIDDPRLLEMINEADQEIDRGLADLRKVR